LSSSFAASLRRIKPEKFRSRLKPRDPGELPFVELVLEPPRKLLYDTTVYIDILQDRFPIKAELVSRAAQVWHSPIAELELAVSCGALDPHRAGTADLRSRIVAAIDNIPEYRRVAPDSTTWRQAGLITGILARVQGYAAGDKARVANDALLFYTARQHGLTVLTRNTRDFDLMLQIDPSGRVLFYRSASQGASGLPIRC
jgi:predicted nucleic acid-binding protein